MQQTLGTILPLLKEYDTIFLNAFVACFYLITLIWLIKLCLYKKFDLYDFLFVVLVYGGYYGMRLIAGESFHGYAFALALISDLYFLYAFNSLIRMNNIRLVFKTHALNHLKNAEYDYFATVDRKDAIKDISISLAAKLGLELKDIRKYKFWEVLTETAFNIVSVNDHLFIKMSKRSSKTNICRKTNSTSITSSLWKFKMMTRRSTIIRFSSNLSFTAGSTLGKPSSLTGTAGRS
jgi:hypothetical protein